MVAIEQDIDKYLIEKTQNCYWMQKDVHTLRMDKIKW